MALVAMLVITSIFGIAAYMVSRRLRELGIRIALGAGQRELVSAALGRTLRLLASCRPDSRSTGNPCPVDHGASGHSARMSTATIR